MSLLVNFHSHSIFSDGDQSPESIAAGLAAAGVRYAALTDHDTVESWQRFQEAMKKRGLACLPGVELTTTLDGRELHLLGYGFDPQHPDLLATLLDIRQAREVEVHSIAGSLRRRGANLPNAEDAPAVSAASGGKLETSAAIDLIHRAGGKVFWAHPLASEPDLQTVENLTIQLKAAGLDGLEALYTPFSESQCASLVEMAARHELLVSAGTDFHTTPSSPALLPRGEGRLPSPFGGGAGGEGVWAIEMPRAAWIRFREALFASPTFTEKPSSAEKLGAQRPLDVIEAIRKVNAITMPSGRPRRIRPRLQSAAPSGNFVLRIDHLTVGYPNKPLFTARKVELRRGEHPALIGPNGSGKTTFLKVLLEQLPPLAGEARLGASLRVGYFAQAHDGLNGEHSVLDELIRHKEMLPGAARNYLAPYLFTGDDIFKPVQALSGGERARLALAILALDGANLLLLDEPTNHLDIPAREALQEVLENFRGTILLVTHDRFLINQLATQIWEIREGRLEVFNGSYREYVLRKAARTSTAQARQLLLNPRPLARDNSKETRRREQSLDLVETRIREQENTLKRLSAELQKAGGSHFERIQELGWQVAKAQARLEELMREWETLVV